VACRSRSTARGKGDHRRLGYADRHTFVGDRGELKKGTRHKMLRDLGLTLGDLTGA
jgi:hypothetical protein